MDQLLSDVGYLSWIIQAAVKFHEALFGISDHFRLKQKHKQVKQVLDFEPGNFLNKQYSILYNIFIV